MIAASLNLTLPQAPSFPTGQPPLGQPLGDGQTINGRNAYPQDNPDGPPLQFVYESANCRLFYQYEDSVDITHMWKRVANVAWSNGTCVPGSTVSSKNNFPMLANDTVPYSTKVFQNATIPKGAGNANITTPKYSASSSSVAPAATTSKPPQFTGAASRAPLNIFMVVGIFSAVLGMLL
jgi:hypothetical protein